MYELNQTYYCDIAKEYFTVTHIKYFHYIKAQSYYCTWKDGMITVKTKKIVQGHPLK